nr:hypothetical protein [Tanacetum cinerariifolium]
MQQNGCGSVTCHSRRPPTGQLTSMKGDPRLQSNNHRPLPDKGPTPTTTIIGEILGNSSPRLAYKRNPMTLQMDLESVRRLVARRLVVLMKLVFSVLWWSSGRHDKLISIGEQSIFLWSLDSSKKSAQVQAQESAGMLHHLSGGAWNPQDVNVVASTSESSIQF